MKIVYAISVALLLTSCRTEDKVQNVVLYGNKTPYPEVLNATLKLENQEYSCTSFDGKHEQLVFMCHKK